METVIRIEDTLLDRLGDAYRKHAGENDVITSRQPDGSFRILTFEDLLLQTGALR